MRSCRLPSAIDPSNGPRKATLGDTALMARALGLAISLVLLLAPATGAASGSGAGLVAGAEETVLRLHDLPSGYVIGGASSCEPLKPQKKDRQPLDRWIARYRPGACEFDYLRAFKAAGIDPAPPLVSVAVLNTPSDEAAAHGFALLVKNVETEFEGEDGGTVSIPEGPTVRLLRYDDAPVGEGAPGTTLFWRHGKLLAAISVGGLEPAENDRAALHFAQIQQQRMEAPAPYTAAERDDTEVGLENPELEIPVYWLGRTFAPGPGFSHLLLAETFSRSGGSSGEADAALLYTDHLSLDHAETIELKLWTPRNWKALRAREGLPFELHCAKTRRLELNGGRAVLYAGRRPGWRCGEHGPKAYAAIVRFPGVVITVERDDTCEDCGRRLDGPYNSIEGMATIARGIEFRRIYRAMS